MNRLTKDLKTPHNDTTYSDVVKDAVDRENIVLTKLKYYEDLEEKVSCPLDIPFKALQQGYIYVDMNIFEYLRPLSKDIQKQKVKYISFNGTYFCVGNSNDYEVALIDYGTSWWLEYPIQQNQDHLLETNEYFTYEKTEICKGIEFEVYRDDYGMSYFLAWRDPKTNEIKEWCCGTCNDYYYEMQDIAEYCLERGNQNE